MGLGASKKAKTAMLMPLQGISIIFQRSWQLGEVPDDWKIIRHLTNVQGEEEEEFRDLQDG